MALLLVQHGWCAGNINNVSVVVLCPFRVVCLFVCGTIESVNSCADCRPLYPVNMFCDHAHATSSIRRGTRTTSRPEQESEEITNWRIVGQSSKIQITMNEATFNFSLNTSAALFFLLWRCAISHIARPAVITAWPFTALPRRVTSLLAAYMIAGFRKFESRRFHVDCSKYTHAPCFPFDAFFSIHQKNIEFCYLETYIYDCNPIDESVDRSLTSIHFPFDSRHVTMISTCILH